ncbi:unnamed protein product [Ascophyllum nodosum]
MGRSGKRSLAALAVAAAALAAAHQSRCYCDAFMAPCSWSAAVPEKARLPATPSSSIRLIRLLPWLLNREGGRRIARRRGHATSQTSATSTARMTAETTSDSGSNEGLDVENIVIIGSGPAGYTAAIYAGRANLKPLCFEGLNSGPPGGQLMTTTDVDNFPGFPDGITGPQLMNNMRDQGARWGAEFETEDVESVDFSSRPFVVRSATRTVKTQTVIVATGATAKRLGLPSEQDFWSRGISACAICDGAAPIFRDEELGVVGGGDSAVEEAVYLTKYSPKVHLFVRRKELNASRAMIDRLAEERSVEVHLGTVVEDVLGKPEGSEDGSPLTGLLVKDEVGRREVPVRGLFYAIGHSPNTNLFEARILTMGFAGQLTLDTAGYVKVKPGTPETSVKGVYAAGDVQDKDWRQAVTAAGTGCTAALAAERFLASKGLLREVHQAAQKGWKKPVKKKEKMEVEDSKTFDIDKTRHRGAYAYQRLYFESDRPLLVKYISPTCGPCKALGRLLDSVADEMGDEIHFVEIDIAASPDIAQNAGITGTPTVQIFSNKALLDTVKGVKGKNVYRARLKAVLEEKMLTS